MRRLRGLRSPVRTAFYTPRKFPKPTRWATDTPDRLAPAVLDQYGTPVRRDVSTLDDGVRALRRRATRAADRGPTRRQRLAALREVAPGATKGDLRRSDRMDRIAGKLLAELEREVDGG